MVQIPRKNRAGWANRDGGERTHPLPPFWIIHPMVNPERHRTLHHTLVIAHTSIHCQCTCKLYSCFIPESSSNSGVCRPVGGMRRTNVMNMKLTLWFMRSSTQISWTILRKKKSRQKSTVQCVKISRPRSSGIRYCMRFVVNLTACLQCMSQN